MFEDNWTTKAIPYLRNKTKTEIPTTHYNKSDLKLISGLFLEFPFSIFRQWFVIGERECLVPTVKI